MVVLLWAVGWTVAILGVTADPALRAPDTTPAGLLTPVGSRQTRTSCRALVYAASVTTTPGDATTLSLEQVDAIRRRVLNVVGHELRTPVTALTGLVSQLASAELDEIRSRLAPALERLAHRTEALLDDLLLASGITTALPTDEPRPHALGPVIDRMWARMGEAATGVRLERDIDAEATATVSGVALERLMGHLLRNAVVYCDHKVSISVRRDGDVVVARIVNDGPVPRDDELALAFEPFYRGEHAVMTGPGLGLGLPISRMLAEQAGGSLGLDRSDDSIELRLELPAA